MEEPHHEIGLDTESQQTQTQNNVVSSFPSESSRHVTLMFADVVYKVNPPKSSSSEEKTILKGPTGIVYPGEMLAMLGPSGSGKTTLLTALGGKLGGGKLTGTITYNGAPFSRRMRRSTGFVTQDDVLYPHLTVTETLVYTALLRLPNSLTRQEKVDQAEDVISQLGLTKCKWSQIGGENLRGISGGERKRVSIGQEMLVDPSVLFLDEPTSGLDSTTAQRIVSTVWKLAAKGGKTVVMTIHQPSSRLFYMFDKVMLLSEGSPLYFGRGGEDVMDYFAGVGFVPSVPMNPSDFLLDLANGVWSTADEDGEEDQSNVKNTLVTAYKNNLADKLKMEIDESGGGEYDQKYHNNNEKEQSPATGWATTWWQQFIILSSRGVKERKYESFAGLKIFQVLFVSFLSGLLWWQSDTSHIQDKVGLMFFYSEFWGFYPMFDAIFKFPQEKRMLQKERSSGMYKLSSYFMSTIISELPISLVLPTAFVIITYWMAGLKPDPTHFFHTLGVVLYATLAAQGLGFAIGALVMHQRNATTLGSVTMLSFLLASGFYVQNVPPFIGWIRQVSIGKHSLKLLFGSQFGVDDVYPCGGSGMTCRVGDYGLVKSVGLDGQGVSAAALLVMIVGYRLVAYLALLRVGEVNK
ncbi:ABC transporter G family member 14 [Linum grandiflorum]